MEQMRNDSVLEDMKRRTEVDEMRRRRKTMARLELHQSYDMIRRLPTATGLPWLKLGAGVATSSLHNCLTRKAEQKFRRLKIMSTGKR